MKRSILLLLVLLPTVHTLTDRIREYQSIPFTQKEIDEVSQVLDAVSGFQGGEIIRPYKPERWWLWSRWSGTVLQQVLPSVAFNMFATWLLCMALRKATHGAWPIGLKPDTSHPLIARLALFDDVWKYLMTLTTFILTFFVGESYSLWKNMYTIGRKVQGRLNDVSMLLATHAKRDDYGRYTPEARALLESVSINIRAFHMLLWASCSKHYNCILTEQGALQLVHRGILTKTQVNTLANMDLPPTQWHSVCLEWIMIEIQHGFRRGSVTGGAPLQMILLEKYCDLRGTFGSIGDVVDGRMPLAYTHLVQILVDSLLVCAPLALYAELGAFSIVSVGILTLFYSGLLDLAKVFLDPLDCENFCQGSVKMDLSVLLRESNAASNKWKTGAEILPFPTTANGGGSKSP